MDKEQLLRDDVTHKMQYLEDETDQENNGTHHTRNEQEQTKVEGEGRYFTESLVSNLMQVGD